MQNLHMFLKFKQFLKFQAWESPSSLRATNTLTPSIKGYLGRNLMEYFFDLLSSFPRSYLTMLVLKSLCPFLPCLLCFYALSPIVFLFCGSPLASPSSLYHLSQLSQSVLSPELSSSDIQRPFGQSN